MKYSEIDKTQKYLEGRLYFTEYNGKTIMISDYTGLSGADYVAVIDKHHEFLSGIDFEGNKIFNLVDFSDTKASNDVIDRLKRNAKTFSKEHVEKTACVGLTALQKVFIGAFTALGLVDLKPFASKEEALVWLTE